jgi:diguanylate cyclase (GGDEF)-like protein
VSAGAAKDLREALLAALGEDAHNTQRLLERLDTVSRERGIGEHAALLLILTQIAFEEGEARGHWEAILAHRASMTSSLGRDVGLRVAVLDYFLNFNRRLPQPALVDLSMIDLRGSGHVDRLTGLAGERTFRAAVAQELRRARRYEGRVAVALFDLDGFGDVDAALGRIVSDRLFREAAILLHNKVRDIDLAARPGDDELALLLPGTDRHGALLVAERFRSQVEAHFASREAGGRPAGLTVSGGVACYPEDARSPEALLERAARALYAAKAAGKNVVMAFAPERRRYVRVELEPGRFEIEVVAPREFGRCRPRDAGRNGILFASPEPLEVGEQVEIRLVDVKDPGTEPLCLRGHVVRLEELPAAESGEDGPGLPSDRYEVGLALDDDGSQAALLAMLERVRARGEREPR